MEQSAAWHGKTGTVIRPVQAVSEDIFIRTVRPRRIVNCLIAPLRNILTYLLTYLPWLINWWQICHKMLHIRIKDHFSLTWSWSFDTVQTHTGHSIASNMFLHFVTLWPLCLTFWPNIKWAGMHYPCGEFGDCSFGHFDSNVRSDSERERITEADECFIPVTE